MNECIKWNNFLRLTVHGRNKVKMPSIHFDCKVLSWFQSFMKTRDKNRIVSWSELIGSMTSRFGEQPFIDPVSEIKKLKQVVPLHLYLEEFDMKFSRTNLDET